MYKVIMAPTDGSGFDREAIKDDAESRNRRRQAQLVRVLATGSFSGIAATAEGTAIAAEVVQSERDTALTEFYALAAECRATCKAEVTVDLHAGPMEMSSRVTRAATKSI